MRSSRSSAASKNIGHAPVITARIANNEDIADPRSFWQSDIGGDDVMLHAKPAHQLSFAPAKRCQFARSTAFPKHPMRIEGIHWKLRNRGIDNRLDPVVLVLLYLQDARRQGHGGLRHCLAGFRNDLANGL